MVPPTDLGRKQAMRLGFPLPLGCGTCRKMGQACEAALGQALRANRFDEVSRLCDRQLPKWYRGGFLFVRPTESVDEAHKLLHVEAGMFPPARVLNRFWVYGAPSRRHLAFG